MNNIMANNTVKCTAILPETTVKELKKLVADGVVPSINQAIKLSVEDFLNNQKKKNYEAAMKEASTDSDFIERTLNCQSDFVASDAELEGGIGEW